MQVSSYATENNFNLSKELWFFLLFNCVGFTVWPLMIYYLGRTLSISYFLDLTLRVWAEQIVYGPLANLSLHTVLSILILFTPYSLFWGVRICINLSRQ